jgi:hypothetical protein
MNPYCRLVDEARLIYAEKRDHIAGIRVNAAKGDRLAKGHEPMLGHYERRLATIAEIGTALASLAEAHDRDADALASVVLPREAAR